MKLLLVFCILVGCFAQGDLQEAVAPDYQGCSDYNGDYVVDVEDLAALLVDWGLSNCWVPAPESLIYYVEINRDCGGNPLAGSTSQSEGLAVIRFDLTQWGSWTSGSYVFSVGPDASGMELRHDDGALGPIKIFAPPADLSGFQKTWSFRISNPNDGTNAIFESIKADPTKWKLYFPGGTNGNLDVCGVLGELVPPTLPPTATPAPLETSSTYATTLSNDGSGSVCESFTNADGLSRTGEARLTLNPVFSDAGAAGATLEGYTIGGSLSLGGAAANWWRQIVSVRLVRVPGAAQGMGPYTLVSGPQASGDISIQQIPIFVSAGADIAARPDRWRLDVVTGTSSFSSFTNKAEICGALTVVTQAPGAPPTAAPGSAPTPFPPFEPRFVSIDLDNTICLPDGPFVDGTTTKRTARADLLLSRSAAGNFITGSISFDVVTGDIPTWWQQATRFDIYDRNDYTLFINIFGSSSQLSKNPFEGLNVPITDSQLMRLISTPGDFVFIASSNAQKGGLVCGNLDSALAPPTAAPAPNAPTAAPILPSVPFTFDITSECSGSGSLAVGTANLIAIPATATEQAAILGSVTLNPGTLGSSVGLLGIYYDSSEASMIGAEDELLVVLFSAGYGQHTSNVLPVTVTVPQAVFSALSENPSKFRLQLNTVNFNTGKGELCGQFEEANADCDCPCMTAAPTAVVTPAPTQADPPPFVAGDAEYVVPVFDASHPSASAAAGTGAGSGAEFTLTYAPDVANANQITLSGSFSVLSNNYRATVTSVSLYRLVAGKPVMQLNLWSGSKGTLGAPRTFTVVIQKPFALAFQEFTSEFFIGTSTAISSVTPVSIAGAIVAIVAPTVAPAPTASPAPTPAPTTPAPTPAPTAPTPRPASSQTDLTATITCPLRPTGGSVFTLTLLQLDLNGGQGQISGNASPLARRNNVLAAVLHRRSGVSQDYPLINGPLLGTQTFETFSVGFLNPALTDAVRRFPGDFDILVTYDDETCKGQLQFA